jgi:acyl-CoA thioesterase-1
MKLFFLYFSIVLCCNSFAETPKRMVILGDSLTEGLGVAKEQAYPSLLEKKINASGKKWQVVNAGISGSTSAGSEKRLQWLMKNKIDLLIIALGANDGLRGLKIEATKKNLSQTIELAKKNKIKIVLAGMLLPPNYGKEYRNQFEKLFLDLSKKYDLILIPFLLDKVGGEIQMNQSDGIHPNEKGHEIIADTVFKIIKDHL